MKVALGQFTVHKEWQQNAQICIELIQRAAQQGADLLVLPEGILARDITDPDIIKKTVQPLDGPFMRQLLAASHDLSLSIVFCIHTPAPQDKVWNSQIVIRAGKIVAEYKKLHLYDAFSAKESTNVTPGNDIPPLIDIAGFKVGLMTCYDVRFPELARRLAFDGAQILVVPAAWVKGPLKEQHWEVLVKARALENTVYVIAVGECGERNIGQSLLVDPFGVTIAAAAEGPALIFAELDQQRIAHARQVLPVLENCRFKVPELKN